MSDEVERWLADATRPPVPSSVLARVDRAVTREGRTARPGRAVAVAALALAGAFLVQGVGNLVAGPWIAEHLGEPHGPHAYVEGALAMIALAACAAAAAVRRAWGGLSVLVCSPLAVSMGLGGIGEVDRFAAGAVLHLAEAGLGVTLALVWLRDMRRDRRPGRREGGA